MGTCRNRQGNTVENNRQIQAGRTKIEQVSAVVQARLTDPKKLVLYGFALGLQAKNPFLSEAIPPTAGTKTAV